MFKKEVTKNHNLIRVESSFEEFKEYFMGNYAGVLRIVITQSTSAGVGMHLNYVADDLKITITKESIIIENGGKPLLGINDSCNICVRENYGSGEHFHCGFGQESFEHGFVAIWFLPQDYGNKNYENGIKFETKASV